MDTCDKEELDIRENFKKDYKLSCPVLDDNWCFNKSLIIWNLEKDWHIYFDAFTKYENFGSYRKEVRDLIVKTVQDVKGFSTLKPPTHSYTIYDGPKTYLQEHLSGKCLLSIDLVKGNFQSLKWLGNKYVLGCNTYDEFINTFTDNDALINSKYFRQMVFGLLNPELQRDVQKMMVYHIIDVIKKVLEVDIVHLTSDEVVFHIQNYAEIELITTTLKNSNLPYQFKIEEFTIHYIKNKYNEPWYVRYNKNNPVPRIMSVHVRYLFQVYNHLCNQPNTTKDFWWRECSRLAQLLEPEQF